ncbi:MAG: hypothetical protein WCK98_05980 [bacterium]
MEIIATAKELYPKQFSRYQNPITDEEWQNIKSEYEALEYKYNEIIKGCRYKIWKSIFEISDKKERANFILNDPKEPLRTSIVRGLNHEVIFYINSIGGVKSLNKELRSELIRHAIESLNLEVFEYLFDPKFANYTDSNGQAPLNCLASRRYHGEYQSKPIDRTIAEILITNGADPHWKKPNLDNSFVPARMALLNRNPVLSLLLDVTDLSLPVSKTFSVVLKNKRLRAFKRKLLGVNYLDDETSLLQTMIDAVLKSKSPYLLDIIMASKNYDSTLLKTETLKQIETYKQEAKKIINYLNGELEVSEEMDISQKWLGPVPGFAKTEKEIARWAELESQPINERDLEIWNVFGRDCSSLQTSMKIDRGEECRPFLGKDELLHQVIIDDLKLIKSHDLTPYLICIPLAKAMEVYSMRDPNRKTFTHRGRNYSVFGNGWQGSKASPFPTKHDIGYSSSSIDITVTDNDSHEELYFPGLIPYIGSQFCFFEGEGAGSYRVSPESVIKFFNMAKQS